MGPRVEVAWPGVEQEVQQGRWDDPRDEVAWVPQGVLQGRWDDQQVAGSQMVGWRVQPKYRVQKKRTSTTTTSSELKSIRFREGVAAGVTPRHIQGCQGEELKETPSKACLDLRGSLGS